MQQEPECPSAWWVKACELIKEACQLFNDACVPGLPRLCSCTENPILSKLKFFLPIWRGGSAPSSRYGLAYPGRRAFLCLHEMGAGCPRASGEAIAVSPTML